MEVNGDWIFENHVYLIHSDAHYIQGGPAPRFTAGVPRNDGDVCVGLESTQLAAAIGVNESVLIEANRSGDLIFLGTADVPPSHGGIRATAYGFQLGDKEGSLIIETHDSEGTA